MAIQNDDTDGCVPRLRDRGAYKLKEACEYLGGISQVSLGKLIARGLIRRHPALRHIVIARAELDRFLKNSN
jgi:hypothetical protein